MVGTQLDEQIARHYERYLGEGHLVERVGEVELWRYSRTEFATAVTRGLVAELPGPELPQELVCSVYHGQEAAAGIILRAIVTQVVLERSGLKIGRFVPGGGMLEGTQITGVLAATHPYLGDGFTTIRGTDDAPIAETRTLVPLTGPEAAFAATAGSPALFVALEEANPRLLDVSRGPAALPKAKGRRSS